MITEHAQLFIEPGREQEFEAAFAQAKLIAAGAGGFRGLRLGRGIENPSKYQLVVEWGSLADHIEGFRGGELFVQWRALLGPFFAQPPEVEHSEPVDEA